MAKDMKIFKANQLVNARYKLNAIELKLMLYTVSKIKPDDMDFWTHELKVKELDFTHKDIKAAARSLVSRVFEVKTPDGWLLMSWLSSVEYNGKSGTLSMTFDPKLKPYLLQLKEQFTAYDLSAVLPMRSAYTIRLYELLIQYQAIGKREFALDELRDLLQVPKSYRFPDLRRQIFEPAMEDINKHGALSVEYEPVKEGRAYTGVIFTFKTVKPKKEGLHAFMKRIRADCVHKVLLITKDKDTGKDIELSVSEKGLLYNRLDPDWKIPKNRAEEIWKILHRQKVC